MTGMLRVPRSRGALSGVVLVLLGLWGGLAALVGPYFHFGFAPDKAWSFTSGRVWLEILPACALLIGGLILLVSANRATAAAGAWIAALGGAWFVVGTPLSALRFGVGRLGAPLGGTTRQVAEQVGLLYGLGAVALFFAAVALGRLAVVAVRDARLAEREAYAEEAPVGPETAGRPQDRPGPIQATQPLPRRADRPPVTPPEQAVPNPAGHAAPRAAEPSDRRVAGGPVEEQGRVPHRPGEGG